MKIEEVDKYQGYFLDSVNSLRSLVHALFSLPKSTILGVL
jgi:hypothetical protein